MPNTSRRTLLMAMTAVRASAANSAPSVGVIGYGNRGAYLARLVKEDGTARVTAVSDLSDDKLAAAQRDFPQARVHRDFQQLLKSDVDALIIATPVFLHAEHFAAAVASGKHVYFEKPAAATVSDCKKILRIADSAPRTLNISFGFQRRYGQVYRKAKQAHDHGSIGKIRWAQVQFVKSEGNGPRPANLVRPVTADDKVKNWGDWQDLSGDLIVENNVHVIDVMNWFMGARPSKAHGAGGRTRTGYGDMRDHVHVTYTYPDNVRGLLVGATIAAPGFRAVFEQFHGDSGVIETSENYWKLLRGLKQEEGEKSPRSIALDSVSAFASRVAENRPENVAARGVESTLTAILGRMAMDRGREVTWEEMMASA